MTTIVGLETTLGEPAVILGADSQMNLSDKKNEPKGKIPEQKIRVGSFYAAAIAGVVTKERTRLERKLEGNKRGMDEGEKEGDIVRRALEKYEKGEKLRHFDEIAYVNAMYTRQEEALPDFSDLIEMIIACQNPFGLWHVDIYGTMTSFSKDRKTFPDERTYPYIVLGSGSEKVKTFFDSTLEEEESNYKPGEIDIDIGIELVNQALLKAIRDPFTGMPFGFVAITKDYIFNYIEEMAKNLKEGQERSIQNMKEGIKRKLTPT